MEVVDSSEHHVPLLHFHDSTGTNFEAVRFHRVGVSEAMVANRSDIRRVPRRRIDIPPWIGREGHVAHSQDRELPGFGPLHLIIGMEQSVGHSLENNEPTVEESDGAAEPDVPGRVVHIREECGVARVGWAIEVVANHSADQSFCHDAAGEVALRVVVVPVLVEVEVALVGVAGTVRARALTASGDECSREHHGNHTDDLSAHGFSSRLVFFLLHLKHRWQP